MVAVAAAVDKQGLKPTLLDLTREGAYTDYLLVVSGRSDRHVGAVADAVERALRDHAGRRPLSIEGHRDGQWALIDYGELVVHVFFHPVRERYDLEGLWNDAPRIPIDVPPDSQLQYSDAYGL